MQEALNKVDGVTQVKTDLGTQTATVTYDPIKTKPETLAKYLTDYETPGHDFSAKVQTS